ncbi:MAG: enamine deaminase RidA (YjgF/YER057c/UK114 family), partial [Planctomycetota bacterium]
MKQEVIHPEGWAPAKGYANGVLVTGGGPTLYVAGQVAWDADQQIVGVGDMGAQFTQVLRNIMAVVEAAGGKAEHIVRMTAFVTDKHAYMDSTKAIGAAWRELLGRHFP